MSRFLLIAPLIFALGCGKKTESPPAGPGGAFGKSGPPDDWTHRELADHLKSKGVSLRVISASALNKPGVTAAFLEDDAGEELIVYLCTDAKLAKEMAGAHNETAFHFGRFAIGSRKERGADPLLERVRNALK